MHFWMGRNKLHFTYIRAGWQLADGMKELNDCFIFDFEGRGAILLEK